MAAGGGQLSRRGVIFSDDGRLLLVPCGCLVKIYSSATGEQTGCLVGHTADVTCVVLNPRNTGEVYSAAKDGTLRLWDYRTEECLRVLQIRETATSMVIHKELNVAYLAILWRDGASGRVITFNLDEGKPGATAMKLRAPAPLAMSPNGSFIATFDRHSLFVWRTGTEIQQPINLHHTKPYTCVAVNNDETILAAGDASGRILIWQNFAQHVPSVKREGANSGKHQPEVPPPVTTLHWHPGPVGCLTFSADSTYLLSGGGEAVLVIWQMDGFKQNFLPRLGGSLVGLAPSPSDSAKYLVRQSDNVLRVVNTATMKVECSVQGPRPVPRGLHPLDAAPATALQPGSGHLLLPAANAQLQLYDTQHDRHVSLLQVAPRNAISSNPMDRGEDATATAVARDDALAAGRASADADRQHHLAAAGGAPAEQCVSHTAFSRDGSVMVTVDVRPDAGPLGSTESALKFWDQVNAVKRDGATEAPFALNTRVDDAHRGPISSVSYHPSQDLVVTTGAADGEFRVWTRMPLPKRPGSKLAAPTCWRCRSLGGYKGLPLTASAFSPDGSLLAVAALSKVTLWDPASHTMAAVLPSPPELAGEPLRSLVFVRNSPFLVGTSLEGVVVWNILTAAVHWYAPLRTCGLAADPHHPRFAVLVPPLRREVVAAAAAAAAEAPAAAAEKQEQDPAAAAPAAGSRRRKGAAAAAPGGDGPATAAAAPQQDAQPQSQQQPEQQQQQPAQRHPGSGGAPRPAGPSCHVLVFDPASPMPRLTAVVPRSSFAQLLFVEESLPQHAAAAAAGMPLELSPLLVVMADRTYAYVRAPGGRKDAPTPQQPAAAAGEGEVSAFEAAFGKLPVPPAGGASAMEVDAVPVAEAPWRALFDAPSHALPPPAALAQAFLRLLAAEPQAAGEGR